MRQTELQWDAEARLAAEQAAAAWERECAARLQALRQQQQTAAERVPKEDYDRLGGVALTGADSPLRRSFRLRRLPHPPSRCQRCPDSRRAPRQDWQPEPGRVVLHCLYSTVWYVLGNPETRKKAYACACGYLQRDGQILRRTRAPTPCARHVVLVQLRVHERTGRPKRVTFSGT